MTTPTPLENNNLPPPTTESSNHSLDDHSLTNNVVHQSILDIPNQSLTQATNLHNGDFTVISNASNSQQNIVSTNFPNGHVQNQNKNLSMDEDNENDPKSKIAYYGIEEDSAMGGSFFLCILLLSHFKKTYTLCKKIVI